MNKYIDAEKLKAEVKNLNLATKTYEEQVAFNNALAMVVEIIDSLQHEQSEVDLEKELDKFYGMYRKDGKTYDIEDGQECVDWKETCSPYFEIAFARHFYELGLNTRKEE